AALTLELVIPGVGNRISKLLDVTLDSSGAVTGRLADVVFKLGPLSLKIIGAELGTPGFKITQAELQLPLGLGGNKAGFNAQNVYITKDGQLDLSRNGLLEINFPNITVGGASGFTIEGPSARLAVNGDEYVFTGRGTFGLPGVGKGQKSGGGQCGVEVGFSVSNLPPPIRQASLSISGCFSIPIDTTGFFLSGVNGSVELDEGNVSVDLGITITGGPLVPGFGALISGSIAAHWDNSWKVGLSGAIKVLGMDALRASLELSQRQGLYGRFDVYAVGGIVNGYAEFRAWQSSGSFHITGSAGVNVKITKGAYVSECVDFGAFDGCIYFPPSTVDIGSARADFGEFRNTEAGGTLYGFKGSLRVLDLGPYSFFVNSSGQVSFRGTNKYQLLQPPALLRAGPNVLGATAQAFSVAPNTPSILGGMLVGSGTPTLELIAPGGTTVYTAGTPGISITNTPTQTLLGINNPTPGTWLINAAGSVAGDQISLSAFGGQPVATVAAPTVAANADGSYTIGYTGSSATPTSTVSLFYDTSPISRTGVPIAQGLPLAGSFTWTPDRIANGTYHIYAMVDDALGVPDFAYAAAPITITDTTPPPVPTNVLLSTQVTSTTVRWSHTAPPDIGGYRLYYTEPGGHTSVIDVTAGADTSYLLAGLYLNGDWQVAVSAYDISGNESAKSAAATTRVTLPTPPPDARMLYLPIVAR
ncbi:MAG: fibronectin type III domain-containing protein, partial [Chloroflexales bacterium]|nr:fibronectin type III domain-containing protein [Chloroflexales bacterium]